MFFLNKFALLLFASLMMLQGNGDTNKQRTIEKTFPAKGQLEISLVSGGCDIKADDGNNIRIQIVTSYGEEDYQPDWNDERERVVIHEEFSSHNHGFSHWTIRVPKKIAVACDTASGDLNISGINGNITAETASGDITLENINGRITIESASGDIELKNASGDLCLKSASGEINASKASGDQIRLESASGDIQVEECQGGFEVEAASGDIIAENVIVTKATSFSAASGNISVHLGKSPTTDLNLETATGDVELNFGGNPLQGFFLCSIKKNDGVIEAPFRFEKTEEYERYGQTYIRKTATLKSASPRFRLESATGSITILEK